jgi:site-specific DNA recombinase
MFDRDGLLELREAAKAKKFDVVIAESQSRLSRDPEDIAGILKRLKHAGIELHTIADGIVDNLKSGLRAIIDSEYRTNLATGITRGQRGLVRDGLMPGAVTFGYDRVPGKPAERVINQEHAEIVRRIFREYADGMSPRRIAAGLTRDGVPAPSGAEAWNHQTLISSGGKARGGIIGNELYIGRLIWGQAIRRKDPDTNVERRTARPKEQHIVAAVPHLRIIEHAVQKVREERAAVRFGPTGKVIRRPVVARGDHLLSGLLRCGACGGSTIICKLSRGKRYVVCSAAHQKSTCAHRRTYQMDVIQEHALAGLRHELADPAGFADLARTHAAEFAAQQRRDIAERSAAEKQRNRLVVQIDRLVRAISDTDEPLSALLASLKAKEAERVGLEERIRLLSAGNIVSMHPTFIDQYLEKIKNLDKALGDDPNAPKNRMAFRNVIDRIVVQPAQGRDYEVYTYGRLSAIMGVDLFPPTRTNKEILTSEGVMRDYIGNAD